MFQPFWLADGFVTGSNHLFKNQTQDSKTLPTNFLSLLTYAMSLILAIVSEAIFHDKLEKLFIIFSSLIRNVLLRLWTN